MAERNYVGENSIDLAINDLSLMVGSVGFYVTPSGHNIPLRNTIDVFVAIVEIVINHDDPDVVPREPRFSCKPGMNPTITFRRFFFERIMQFMRPSVNEMIHALHILRKILVITDGGVLMTHRSVDRLVSVAVLLAIKFNRENTHVYSNLYYADSIGLSLVELNMLEFLFLTQINFSMFISNAEYTATKISLLKLL